LGRKQQSAPRGEAAPGILVGVAR